MTQCEKIWEYMKNHDGITPLEAMSEIGCMRLAARINEMVKDGYEIEREQVKSLNRYGDTVRFMKYRAKKAV